MIGIMLSELKIKNIKVLTIFENSKQKDAPENINIYSNKMKTIMVKF